MAKRKAIANTQVTDNEVERLIKKSFREIRRNTDIKDKDKLRQEEIKIRNQIEYENSFEGIFNNLKFYNKIILVLILFAFSINSNAVEAQTTHPKKDNRITLDF